MNLIPWRKKSEAPTPEKALQSVDDRGWMRIFDWMPAAWQSHTPLDTDDSVASNPIVFACVTLIASDLAKLAFTTERLTTDGVWQKFVSQVLSRLNKPNNYQNHIQFKECWLYSKLLHGNTYVLMQEDGWHVLDPMKVMPLVSDEGEVFYRVSQDNLAGLNASPQIVVPATAIIHDRFNTLFHPLIGLSPLYAVAIAAQQVQAIEKDGKAFFQNAAAPGGILSAPGPISPENAARVKEYWEANFTGKKAGSLAVVGDGLVYTPIRMSAVDAQIIQQLGWSAERICAAFHVPPYKVGVGSMPTHDNIEALTQDYYSQCLQKHAEDMETCTHDGLGMPVGTRVQLDLDALFRMDSERKIKGLSEGVKGSIFAPNEARIRMNLPPLEGGDSVYLQQQNYSLEALARRDAQEDPFSTGGGAEAPSDAPDVEDAPEDETDNEDAAKLLSMFFEKELLGLSHETA